MRRQGQGAYANLVKELNAEEPEQFRQYHRMDRQSFESILAMVNTLIVKHDTQMRFAIHFAPPSWMFTFIYYACAVKTIRKQKAFVRRTRKDFGTRGRNYQTCLIFGVSGTNDKSCS